MRLLKSRSLGCKKRRKKEKMLKKNLLQFKKPFLLEIMQTLIYIYIKKNHKCNTSLCMNANRVSLRSIQTRPKGQGGATFLSRPQTTKVTFLFASNRKPGCKPSPRLGSLQFGFLGAGGKSFPHDSHNTQFISFF